MNANVNNISQIKKLSYFDALALLGEFPLHCGGMKNTANLLYMTDINSSMKILEVGCGTGITTRSLIQAGLSVDVVEISSSMISRMLNNCKRKKLKIPKYYNISAEDLSVIKSESYDLIILECVFGFINDKVKAVSEFSRVLKNNGKIAITDFQYNTTPPDNILKGLKDYLDIKELLYSETWNEYFKGFKKKFYQKIKQGKSFFSSKENIQKMMMYSDINNKFCDQSLSVLESKFKIWENFFNENRLYMSGLNVIYEKK